MLRKTIQQRDHLEPVGAQQKIGGLGGQGHAFSLEPRLQPISQIRGAGL